MVHVGAFLKAVDANALARCRGGLGLAWWGRGTPPKFGTLRVPVPVVGCGAVWYRILSGPLCIAILTVWDDLGLYPHQYDDSHDGSAGAEESRSISGR